MFGYVNIFKDELKVKEYLSFRSYYCGLCRALGKNCNQFSRMGLSYDMTFLAVLLDALNKEPSKLCDKSCVAHPFNKRKNVVDNQAVSYSADVSVILMYNKLLDDWHDDRQIKALLMLLFYHHGYKKLKKKYQKLCEATEELLSRLSGLEKAKSNDIDSVADCFAKICEMYFAPDFSQGNERQLKWLGYNVGRWIYIIDAFNDMERDAKRKNYNPFLVDYTGDNLLEYKKSLAKRLDVSLTYTLDNATGAYELISIYKNDEILRNILLLGLSSKQNQILNKGCEIIESI